MLNAFAQKRRLTLALTTLGFVASMGVAQATDFTGAGATFPAPAYTAWSADYKAKTGSSLNYQAIGSGGGQKQILARTVDFGASDAPMESKQLADGKLLQFPAVIGSVVLIVNLDGVKPNEIKLDGATLGDIYLGKIAKWNDPAIVKLNPDIKLPDLAIQPVYRSDGSGTTYVYTTYLADVSADWKGKVGAATSVSWPAGTGAKGNDGVAGAVKNAKGAIGYVEYVYAAANGLTTTQLGNKAGKFVPPTVPAFQAAAANADWKGAKDFAASMINTAGDTTWPIVSATFILLPKDPKDTAASLEVMKFFDWAFKDGGAVAEKLHYIPLPAAVQDDVRKAWKAEIKDGSGAPVYK
ncbi:phosphate ABC transporter substrate-binding protein PstS [Siculibacillus lacustris]|uniref:Phosphate-binding protein PstS n=1 Tax=Siculibacillus lacustris TaxID=1549641 RepID=A0A4Q9VHH8_9HYPH|nr:phosphate ABC transporter substrate-binding protein PstS [Siculibacillus lacustris]TBW34065.1 phosphate ABC transporter substrate-binding protein PstS [Siculibacillus lacustris]